MHDYVMIWNSVALELNRRDHTGKLNAKNNRGPTASSRALAIVHLAMHDAFFGLKARPALSTPIAGLQGAINTYLNVTSLSPPNWSAELEGAAVSGAAATTLFNLYPDFGQLIEDALRGFDFGINNPGYTFGVAVANAILADRATDGASEGGGVPSIDRYWRHREDPTDIGQGFLGQRYGAVRLFSASTIPPIANHPLPRTPAYDSSHDEVRAKGSRILDPGTPGADIKPRSPFETLIGLYWAYDGASQIGTPPRLYNQIVRNVIASKLAFGDPARQAVSARLLALVNVAMGDAGIAAWYHKYVFQLWRPILGVREYDNSFWVKNPVPSFHLHKRADPWWLPLGAPRTNEPGRDSFTPPFPAYPSGHATFGAAAFEVTRRFFGVAANAIDNLRVDFVSDELDGRSIAEDGSYRSRHLRRYDSLLQAMFDNSVSRVYLGVHWRFDGIGENVVTAADILTDNSNIGGVPLGRALAANIFQSGMKKSAAPRATITPVNL